MSIIDEGIQSSAAAKDGGPLAGLFDDEAGWTFASAKICRRENLSSNTLAFHETSQTLCLIVKQSSKGTDYPLSRTGLEYLKGARKDGKAVSHAFVVLANPDQNAGLELVSYSTAEETRDRLKGIKPRLGDWGWFWWLSSDGTPQVASGGSFVNDDEGF